MNSKIIIITIITIIGIIIITSIIMLLNKSFEEKLLLEKDYDYRFVYIKNNIEIDVVLSKEEKERLFNIFNKQAMFKDNLSCGFDENMMFIFGKKKILIASDGCPFFYIKDENRYVKITKEEMELIKNIIEEHGGKVPNL